MEGWGNISEEQKEKALWCSNWNRRNRRFFFHRTVHDTAFALNIKGVSGGEIDPSFFLFFKYNHYFTVILQYLQHRDNLQSSMLVLVDLNGLIRAQSFLCCPTFQVFASDYVVSLLLSDNYTAQPSVCNYKKRLTIRHRLFWSSKQEEKKRPCGFVNKLQPQCACWANCLSRLTNGKKQYLASFKLKHMEPEHCWSLCTRALMREIFLNLMKPFVVFADSIIYKYQPFDHSVLSSNLFIGDQFFGPKSPNSWEGLLFNASSVIGNTTGGQGGVAINFSDKSFKTCFQAGNGK